MTEARERPISPRAARLRLSNLQTVRHMFHLVRQGLQKEGIDVRFASTVDEAVNQQLMKLEHACAGRVSARVALPRELFDKGTQVPNYLLFLDECGIPHGTQTNFPVFCLCGCIVEASQYEQFESSLQAWKHKALGTAEYVIHEVDVRQGTSKFYRRVPQERYGLVASLNQHLETLDFTCIAAVIDKRAMSTLYPDGKVDDFLPSAGYLMTIDFVMERFAHFLDKHSARGIVIAESRGPKEDAILHAEFIRLLIEGTQFVAPGSFRRFLRPYMEFYGKQQNCAGLQVADLAARPVAEKIIGRVEIPDRWELFSSRLYDGMKQAPHKYGLKVFPLTEGEGGNDPFPEMERKAKESA